jgi:hypothetical protein
MDWSWSRFIWGCVGASAPEILRLYRIATSHTRKRVTKNIGFYLFIVPIFIALGGLFAVAWGDDNPLKCIWVGVSLPVIISTLANQMPGS